MQLRRTLPAAALCLLIAACGPKKFEPIPQLDPDVARAAQLLQTENYLQAASLYRDLAARTPGETGYDYLLQAAQASLLGGDLQNAELILQQVGNLPLSWPQRFLSQLLQAELASAQMQHALALQVLRQITPDRDISQPLQERYFRDLAEAYRAIGNLLETANALQQLDALLQDRQQKLAVQTDILRSLAALNELVLINLQPSPPGVSGGWMQLALLVKQHPGDSYEMSVRMQEWRARFPNHPALPELLDTLQARMGQQLRQAQQIAVLLPQSGPFANAAAALRDGMLVSLYKLPPEERPELRLYDTSDSNNLWPVFSRAVAEGAELVVGPLQKESVEQLARAGELPVPVLALNEVDLGATSHSNFFMFALSPEGEARQVAERIWSEDLRYPLILVPQGDWGERFSAAFLARWQALSGRQPEVGRYDAESNDFSTSITSLLHLDRSEARWREMQRWLGRSLEFEPRRRTDVDAMFVVAKSRQAQSMLPMLQFYQAGDLPVFTTWHAWTGQLNSRQLADMRGLMLADVPLMINQAERETLAQDLPAVQGPAVRLYAMGMDALKLTSQLLRLQSSPYESVDGESGNLFMDAQNRILRQGVWLKLDEPVQILGYAARLDLTDAPATSLPGSYAPSPIDQQLNPAFPASTRPLPPGAQTRPFNSTP